MGHRKFYDQVLEDIIHYDTYKITDQIDVTTLKDYMQVNLKNIYSIKVNLVVDEPNQFVTIILPERDLLYLMVTQCMCIYRFHN